MPAGQRSATDQAIEAYINGAIWASARLDYTPGGGPKNWGYTTSSNIIVKGRSLVPIYNPSPPPYEHWNWLCPVGGFKITVFDPIDLNQLESGVYYIKDPGNTEEVQELYQSIARDYTTPKFPQRYSVVVCAFGLSAHDFPQADFANWLQSCGAEMKGWRNHTSMSPYEGCCTYICIGKQGLVRGNALERFAITGDQAGVTQCHTEALKPVYASA